MDKITFQTFLIWISFNPIFPRTFSIFYILFLVWNWLDQIVNSLMQILTYPEMQINQQNSKDVVKVWKTFIAYQLLLMKPKQISHICIFWERLTSQTSRNSVEVWKTFIAYLLLMKPKKITCMYILRKAHVTNFQKFCWSMKNLNSLSIVVQNQLNILELVWAS